MAIRYGNTACPDTELWQSVVYRAYMDALNPYSESITKRQADAWLRRRCKDFQTVCHLANLDPDYIADMYAQGRVSYADLADKPQNRKAA